MRVSVVGGGTALADDEAAAARAVGERLGERGHEVVCGGRGGVMAAACRGASAAGAHTIGILPGDDPREANEFVDTAIVTGMGNARNALVALNGDGIVAIGGNYGTLSEIALGLDAGRPVAGLRTHDVAGVEPCETPADAVAYLETAVDDPAF